MVRRCNRISLDSFLVVGGKGEGCLTNDMHLAALNIYVYTNQSYLLPYCEMKITAMGGRKD